MARVGHALVDVHLATGPFVALQALALERAFGVEAAASVLTGIGTCNVLRNTALRITSASVLLEDLFMGDKEK